MATSAARDASNGDEFLRAAGEAAGNDARVAVRDRGSTAVVGRRSLDLDPAQGPFLIVDIGGGSTELVAGSRPDDPDIVAVSLQVGCVRVTERYLLTDPPTPRELADGEAMIGELLDEAKSAHPRLAAARRLVGLAGTVTTLASLQLGLDEYDREQVHHAVLSLANVLAWYRTLAAEIREARLDRAGHDSGAGGRDRRRCHDPVGGDGQVRVRRVPGVRVGHPGRDGGQSSGLTVAGRWRAGGGPVDGVVDRSGRVQAVIRPGTAAEVRPHPSTTRSMNLSVEPYSSSA